MCACVFITLYYVPFFVVVIIYSLRFIVAVVVYLCIILLFCFLFSDFFCSCCHILFVFTEETSFSLVFRHNNCCSSKGFLSWAHVCVKEWINVCVHFFLFRLHTIGFLFISLVLYWKGIYAFSMAKGVTRINVFAFKSKSFNNN